MTSFKNKLIKMNACQDAVDWVGNRGLKRAWHESTRADRMLWLCDKLGIDKKLVVLAGCDCAETALQFVPEGEDAPANTLQVTRNWCAGKATLQEVKDADDTVSYPYPDAYPAAGRAAFRAYNPRRTRRAVGRAAVGESERRMGHEGNPTGWLRLALSPTVVRRGLGYAVVVGAIGAPPSPIVS